MFLLVIFKPILTFLTQLCETRNEKVMFLYMYKYVCLYFRMFHHYSSNLTNEVSIDSLLS